MTRGIKVLLYGTLAVILALSTFIGGILVDRFLQHDQVPLPPVVNQIAPTGSADQTLLDDVRALIKTQALKPSSDDSITANAIEGMLKSLPDKYAMYFDPKHFGYFKDETQGNFGGIGVTLSVKDGHAIIVEPMKGTPAVKAGLKAADEILKIDGWSKPGWTSDEVVPKVRGKEGSKVTLLIRRKGVKDFSVSIVRAQITYPNVHTEKVGPDHVGYMRLFSFNATSGKDIAKAIHDLDKQGAKGYILDLRENPGGLLTAGVDVASLFIKAGPIVRVDERNKPEEVTDATGNQITDKPLVVLVDADSASASEIVGGALQDYKRAVLVGTRSYGKGSVQTIQDLPNGGAVKLTIAHYLTPNKRAIDGIGLHPDLLVPMDPKLQASAKTDTQLKAAKQRLTSMFK